jgi:REP element-mobilizing transposase RayT
MEVMPDHIHLLVDCRPQFYIPDMIKESGEMALHQAPGAEEGTLGRSPVESLLLRCDCK